MKRERYEKIYNQDIMLYLKNIVYKEYCVL